jgi:hypothetical protein
MADYPFLDELRQRFENGLDIKDKLEGKANNTITVAGLMSAIFMAFGGQILDNVQSSNPYFLPAMTILLAELFSTLAAVVFSIMAYRAGGYDFPLSRSEFLSDDADGTYNKQKIMDYQTIDNAKYYELCKKYLRCIKRNEKENAKKVEKIDLAQYALIVAIVLIPIFAAIVILSK